MESLVVEVLIDNAWSKICTLYNTFKNIKESEFAYYFDNLRADSIIAGYFNCHYQTWSS